MTDPVRLGAPLHMHHDFFLPSSKNGKHLAPFGNSHDAPNISCSSYRSSCNSLDCFHFSHLSGGNLIKFLLVSLFFCIFLWDRMPRAFNEWIVLDDFSFEGFVNLMYRSLRLRRYFSSFILCRCFPIVCNWSKYTIGAPVLWLFWKPFHDSESNRYFLIIVAGVLERCCNILHSLHTLPIYLHNIAVSDCWSPFVHSCRWCSWETSCISRPRVGWLHIFFLKILGILMPMVSWYNWRIWRRCLIIKGLST